MLDAVQPLLSSSFKMPAVPALVRHVIKSTVAPTFVKPSHLLKLDVRTADVGMLPKFIINPSVAKQTQYKPAERVIDVVAVGSPAATTVVNPDCKASAVPGPLGVLV